MFEAMTSRYISGRTVGRDYEPATEQQLASTAVIEVPIEEMTAKMPGGGPKGPNDAAEEKPTRVEQIYFAAGVAGIPR